MSYFVVFTAGVIAALLCMTPSPPLVHGAPRLHRPKKPDGPPKVTPPQPPPNRYTRGTSGGEREVQR